MVTLTSDVIFEKVKEQIRNILGLEAAGCPIDLSDNLAKDLHLDDLDVVDLLILVEDIFDLDLQAADVEDTLTVGALVSLVERLATARSL